MLDHPTPWTVQERYDYHTNITGPFFIEDADGGVVAEGLKEAVARQIVAFQPVKYFRAEDEGYGKFNTYPHLCVDVPNGGFTISARTSDRQRVTVAFVPDENGVPHCVDILHHDSPVKADNGSPVQQMICFTPGNHVFRSGLNDKKPHTLTTLILHAPETRIVP